MKKLFTLIAFLTCFLGAKAEWVEDYSIDYSASTGFPFYVMGYVPEWVDGVMTDLGGLYSYSTEETEFSTGETTTTNGGVVYYRIANQPGDDGNIGVWHQYFIADGIPTEVDGAYTIKALVKASKEVTMNVNMGWGWGNGEQASATVTIPESADFVEVEWEYSGINGTSCNLVAQPNTDAVIEWKSLTVGHNQKEQKPVEWANIIVNGDASAAWENPDMAAEDENNGSVCAWSKEWGYLMNATNADAGDVAIPVPHPSFIEDGVFVSRAKAVDPVLIYAHDVDLGWAQRSAGTEMDDNTWQNQFWINFPRPLKEGESFKLYFRYKASKDLTVSTQYHQDTPGNYLGGGNVGNLSFTTEWQEYDKELTATANMKSIAFNLTGSDDNWREDADFFFDDLRVSFMVLEEGYFAAATDIEDGDPEYDYDNAVEFTDAGDGLIAAVVGGESEDEWVNQVMISTARGNDKGFKTNTLKVSGDIVNDPLNYMNYEAAANAKIKLPVRGQWKIYIDTEDQLMSFEKLVGEQDKDPIDIVTNPTEFVIDATDKNGAPDWNNQFWIMANRVFTGNESTTIEFEYKIETEDAVEARVSTQWHSGTPGDYKGETSIPFTFTDQWQSYKGDLNPGDGVQSFTFNMACEETGYKYVIKNVKWYLKNDELNAQGLTFENFVDAESKEGFYVKVDGGDTYRYDQLPGDETKGDINGDGKINGTDIQALINAIVDEIEDGDENFATFDINGDGKVNGTDIQELINIILDQE